LPFGPWADAFRKGQVIRDPQLLSGLGPGWLAELARLFPELAEPGRQPATDAADQLRLFQAVGQLLAHLAAGQPLLFVLEDLHWADEMSLRLLSFLGRRLPEWRVLIVGTAREEELSSAPMLRHVLEELKREQRLLELPLSPLSHGETVTLVRALARPGAQHLALTQLGDELWRASEGNPFFIVETMQSLQEGRAPLASGLRLPERIHELIAGRLERLSDRSRDLVAAAAVIGRECDFPLLQRASGLTDREAAEGIEELVRRRVLRVVGERFDFTHDQIREVAYGYLLPPRRKLLHGLVAKALEELYAENVEPHYGALGVHYREAEVWGKAVEYLTRFAETVARKYADVEAVTALQEALGYVERLPAEQRAARFLDLVLRQANLFFFLGRFAETVDLLLRQQERLEHLASAALTGPYYFLLAQAYSVLGDRERSAGSARRAIEAARLCGDDVTRGRAHYVLAREAYWLGQPRHGIEHGHQAIALLGQTSEPYSLAMAHWWVGRNHGFIGEFDEALESAARALSIADMTGDRRLQSHITWTVGDLHAMRGDWERGIEICERALTLSPDPLNIANASGHLGSAYLEKGDPAHAVPLLQQSVGQFSAMAPAGQARGWFTMQLGEAYLLNGELERARDLTDQGLEILEKAGYRRGIAWGRRTLGRIALASRAYSEAEDQFNQALATFVAVSAAFEAGRTHLALADLAQVQGDIAGAAVHLSEAHMMFTALGVPVYAERTREVARKLGVSLSERPASSR
jgi:tetratricopeptide (TPR) repeat protein